MTAESFKFLYIQCAACTSTITLQTFTDRAITSRADQNIECPKCGKVYVYSGDDFMTAQGLDFSR